MELSVTEITCIAAVGYFVKDLMARTRPEKFVTKEDFAATKEEIEKRCNENRANCAGPKWIDERLAEHGKSLTAISIQIMRIATGLEIKGILAPEKGGDNHG